MPIYAENMRYEHFAEICEKCGNMRNMRQSHIRVKMTCLAVAKANSQLKYSGTS